MTKKQKRLLMSALVCAMILAIAVGLTGCIYTDPQKPQDTTFTLSFETNGGNALESITLEKGQATILPEATKANYAFGGWYFDNGTFNDVANGTTLKYLSPDGDLTVYAKWNEIDLTKDGMYNVELTFTVSDAVILDAAPEGFVPTFESNVSKEESGITIIGGKKYLDLVVYGSQEFGFFDGGLKYVISYNDKTLTYGLEKDRINSMDLANLDGRREYRFAIQDDAESITFTVTEKHVGERVMASYNCATYNITVAFSDMTVKTYAEDNEVLEDGIYTVETHVVSVSNGGVSMNEAFNDTRAYILVENGEMTMYKYFNAYMGMVYDADMIPITGEESWYNYLATYTGYTFITPVANAFDADDSFNADYTLKECVGVETWFDSQSGQYTFSWKVSDWKDSYRTTGTVTGFMLEAMGMASCETLLKVDYKTLLKTDDVVLPTKPEGEEIVWNTTVNGNVTASTENIKESWIINFIWQGELDSQADEKTKLSFTSFAQPKTDEKGEITAEVRYTIYNADITKNIYADGLRVELGLGDGNRYNSGARYTLPLSDRERGDNKEVALELSEVVWLKDKSFDQNNEMDIQWELNTAYDIPEAAIVVDGLSFSLMKQDSSGSGTLIPGSGYKLFAYDSDKNEWRSHDNGFSDGMFKKAVGSNAYKYMRLVFSLRDQYGDEIEYRINITMRELDIVWGLAEGDESGIDSSDYGTLIKANVGDTVKMPRYICTVDGKEKEVMISNAYVYTGAKKEKFSYTMGEEIIVPQDVYLIEVKYTLSNFGNTSDQSKYVYISVNGKLDIDDITASESVTAGEKAYFIAPSIKLDGVQVISDIGCYAFGYNGLKTSFIQKSVTTEKDNQGHTYVTADENTDVYYLSVNIACRKLAGDGSALGYNWNVTLYYISKITVQSAENA